MNTKLTLYQLPFDWSTRDRFYKKDIIDQYKLLKNDKTYYENIDNTSYQFSQIDVSKAEITFKIDGAILTNNINLSNFLKITYPDTNNRYNSKDVYFWIIGVSDLAKNSKNKYRYVLTIDVISTYGEAFIEQLNNKNVLIKEAHINNLIITNDKIISIIFDDINKKNTQRILENQDFNTLNFINNEARKLNSPYDFIKDIEINNELIQNKKIFTNSINVLNDRNFNLNDITKLKQNNNYWVNYWKSFFENLYGRNAEWKKTSNKNWIKTNEDFKNLDDDHLFYIWFDQKWKYLCLLYTYYFLKVNHANKQDYFPYISLRVNENDEITTKDGTISSNKVQYYFNDNTLKQQKKHMINLPLFEQNKPIKISIFDQLKEKDIVNKVGDYYIYLSYLSKLNHEKNKMLKYDGEDYKKFIIEKSKLFNDKFEVYGKSLYFLNKNTERKINNAWMEWITDDHTDVQNELTELYLNNKYNIVRESDLKIVLNLNTKKIEIFNIKNNVKIYEIINNKLVDNTKSNIPWQNLKWLSKNYLHWKSRKANYYDTVRESITNFGTITSSTIYLSNWLTKQDWTFIEFIDNYIDTPFDTSKTIYWNTQDLEFLMISLKNGLNDYEKNTLSEIPYVKITSKTINYEPILKYSDNTLITLDFAIDEYVKKIQKAQIHLNTNSNNKVLGAYYSQHPDFWFSFNKEGNDLSKFFIDELKDPNYRLGKYQTFSGTIENKQKNIIEAIIYKIKSDKPVLVISGNLWNNVYLLDQNKKQYYQAIEWTFNNLNEKETFNNLKNSELSDLNNINDILTYTPELLNYFVFNLKIKHGDEMLLNNYDIINKKISVYHLNTISNQKWFFETFYKKNQIKLTSLLEATIQHSQLDITKNFFNNELLLASNKFDLLDKQSNFSRKVQLLEEKYQERKIGRNKLFNAINTTLGLVGASGILGSLGGSGGKAINFYKVATAGGALGFASNSAQRIWDNIDTEEQFLERKKLNVEKHNLNISGREIAKQTYQNQLSRQNLEIGIDHGIQNDTESLLKDDFPKDKVYILKKAIGIKDRDRIIEFYHLFGTKINEFEKFTKTEFFNREMFNYLSIANVIGIFDNIPNVYLTIIKTQLSVGIRFWHKKINFTKLNWQKT